MAPVRVAVVGAGVIGRVHLAAAQTARGCTLAALVDPAPSAAQLAAQAGVPHFTDLPSLLAAGVADAVVLATPNALHANQARACIAARLPVLVEKPVCASVAEAQALLRDAQIAGAADRVLVGHHRAHSTIMAQACAIVASGQLGRLVAATGSATFYKPDRYFDDAPWRREHGGGPILLNLIHEVHSLRMLCGDIVAVQALASNAVRGHVVEDSVAIGLRFANGALGSFMLSDCAASARSWEQTAQENPAYAAYPDEDCYVVSGTRGSLSVPTMRLQTFRDDATPSWFEPFECRRIALQRVDPIVAQMAHFGDLARGTVRPRVSLRDGLLNLQVTEAIAQAAASGRVVDVDG